MKMDSTTCQNDTNSAFGVLIFQNVNDAELKKIN